MSMISPSEWDAPDHISLSEREFLVDRAETINGIIAASYLQAGQVLLQVKRKFQRDPELNGWFTKWMDDTLPFSSVHGYHLMRLAEQVEDDPEMAKACTLTNQTVMVKISSFPSKIKAEVLSQISGGVRPTITQLNDLGKEPEVQLIRTEELVEEIETTLLRYELTGNTSAAGKQKKRLAKAMKQLQEQQAVIDQLQSKRTMQDVVMQRLQKQLNQRQVEIENMCLDPQQNRKRELARTVVDATRGLDLLLSTIDRYGTDKPELGLEAIETIERKLQEVKQKLRIQDADRTT